MAVVLVIECQQEVSSFSPVPSGFELFQIVRGNALFASRRGTATYLGGAIEVLEGRAGIDLVPVYGAFACSAGELSADGFAKLSGELLGALSVHGKGADLVYFAMHGAMAAAGESDPEGYILEQARAIVGPDVPFVMSLDLHGILTARMLRHCQALVTLQTYPHVDLDDTGRRAARLIIDVIEGGARPVAARVRMPMLARGDECITESGIYGRYIERARAIEQKDGVLAATLMIGNPFTDVPELCCQAVVVTDGDLDLAAREVLALCDGFFDHRATIQAGLVPVSEAVRRAGEAIGPVILTDAADAPSSGGSGDSNVLVKALVDAGYQGRILAPLVDAPAVRAAFEAGIGARRKFHLGGSSDPRFSPMEIEAEVVMLSNGDYTLESWGTFEHGGLTAVLEAGNVTFIVTTEPVMLFDRSLFLAHGRDPKTFDVIIVKSPHCQPQFFDDWAEININVDAPGSTSANLPTLGHKRCQRPMYPMEPGTTFTANVERFS